MEDHQSRNLPTQQSIIALTQKNRSQIELPQVRFQRRTEESDRGAGGANGQGANKDTWDFEDAPHGSAFVIFRKRFIGMFGQNAQR